MALETAAWGGARLLLRRLRDLMAGPGTAQDRLDRIAKLIAGDMVAEVCSIYVLRPGAVLELYATQGLRPAAVHRTRLHVGEGLIGQIAAHAEPLALADAQSDPHFAYRPETGEEIYHSLLGVPILRGGRVLGVLAIQNRTRRTHSDEEIETLETVAMVLAELVAGGELVSLEEMRSGLDLGDVPERLEGAPVSAGLVSGAAVMHRARVVVSEILAKDTESELGRLREAMRAMQDGLDDLLARADIAGAGEHRDVLETYRMFAHDRGWSRRIEEAVRAGLTAETAVQKVQSDMRARMLHASDRYLRERLMDLEDLTNRLLEHLIGEGATRPLPPGAIIVARDLGPAELLDFDPTHIAGVILEEGSSTSHVSIVARALAIPLVIRVGGALSSIEEGDHLILDAESGVVYVRPGEDILASFEVSLDARVARERSFAALRDTPAITRDDHQVELLVNAGLIVDLQRMREAGADGVGLYRTEIHFMARRDYPDVGEQADLYGRVLDEAGERPVVFRTLDVGGDKVLHYLDTGADANPAMGWRALRLMLDRPLLLRHQLRALILAGGGRALRVLFPMVAEVSEFEAARAILDLELERAVAAGGAPPAQIFVGAMLEVPALAWQLPQLLARVDFLSIGSNDLMQFFFASDRGSARLEGRYDPISPPALAFFRRVLMQARAAGVPVTLCGEIAGRTLDAMALIGLGFRSLSMAPASIGPVKRMIRSLDSEPLERYLIDLIATSGHSIRERLRAYARDHGVAL